MHACMPSLEIVAIYEGVFCEGRKARLRSHLCNCILHFAGKKRGGGSKDGVGKLDRFVF